MRVLHVITALGVGGAERMLLKLLQSRALSTIEQRVVAMLPGGKMAQPMRATGAHVDELAFLSGLPVFSGGRALARLARGWDPDVVHGWLYHGNLGAMLARKSMRRRVPLLWGIRQSLPTVEGENLFARTGLALNRFFSRQPEMLLFNSRTSLSEHKAYGFAVERARCLPNGFDVEGFAPDAGSRRHWRDVWKVGDETSVFGVFARYHPAKDHAGFLRAARRVRAARPATMFVMVGTGVDAANDELMRIIHEEGLAGNVRLLGEQADVAGLMAALDVYVSSSARIEAFSNSVGEAMSCGVPCVVTDVGDSPFVIGNTGRVVPPSDPEALALAMIAMADLPVVERMKLGAQARNRIVSEFEIEEVAARQGAIYRELVSAMTAGA